jgi:hypothetical protein
VVSCNNAHCYPEEVFSSNFKIQEFIRNLASQEANCQPLTLVEMQTLIVNPFGLSVRRVIRQLRSSLGLTTPPAFGATPVSDVVVAGLGVLLF